MWFINYLSIFLTIIFLNIKAKNFVKKKAEETMIHPYEPLPDTIHLVSPKIPLHTGDYIMFITSIYTIFQYFSIGLNDWLLNVHCLMYSLLLRPFFICSTIFPSCLSKPTGKMNFYDNCLVSTHDFMFSGHTCVFTFLGKCVGGIMGNLIQFFFPFIIIMARAHYTIDVLVSITVYNFFYNFIINNSLIIV